MNRKVILIYYVNDPPKTCSKGLGSVHVLQSDQRIRYTGNPILCTTHITLNESEQGNGPGALVRAAAIAFFPLTKFTNKGRITKDDVTSLVYNKGE